MRTIRCHWCKQGIAPDGGACPYCNGNGYLVEHPAPGSPGETEPMRVKVTIFDQSREQYAERTVECGHFDVANGVLLFYREATDTIPFAGIAAWDFFDTL